MLTNCFFFQTKKGILAVATNDFDAINKLSK